ncbi:hypothetical protein CISG_03328 [Coccidioides immitis RMSCC 3703]|uniref:Uncharacterized protein n=1 Tax=Coccidioides immitis RMSCC 3703 TaxID=454286 RepID=A0A0J8THC1_COCIT|nr:hypothetical protein CISG_03328 [Coccidioides immitis RMSCC 3703]
MAMGGDSDRDGVVCEARESRARGSERGASEWVEKVEWVRLSALRFAIASSLKGFSAAFVDELLAHPPGRLLVRSIKPCSRWQILRSCCPALARFCSVLRMYRLRLTICPNIQKSWIYDTLVLRGIAGVLRRVFANKDGVTPCAAISYRIVLPAPCAVLPTCPSLRGTYACFVVHQDASTHSLGTLKRAIKRVAQEA